MRSLTRSAENFTLRTGIQTRSFFHTSCDSTWKHPLIATLPSQSRLEPAPEATNEQTAEAGIRKLWSLIDATGLEMRISALGHRRKRIASFGGSRSGSYTVDEEQSSPDVAAGRRGDLPGGVPWTGLMLMVLCSDPLLGAFKVWRAILAPDDGPLRPGRTVVSPDGYKLVPNETGICIYEGEKAMRRMAESQSDVSRVSDFFPIHMPCLNLGCFGPESVKLGIELPFNQQPLG